MFGPSLLSSNSNNSLSDHVIVSGAENGAEGAKSRVEQSGQQTWQKTMEWERSGKSPSSNRVGITRGVQKVRRPTQLATRYAHHILSLFKIVT